MFSSGILFQQLMHGMDKLWRCSAASPYYRCSVLHQNFHVSGKLLRRHAVNRIPLIIDYRHSRIRFCNHRNRNSLPDIADHRYQLVWSLTEQLMPTASAPALSRATAASTGISAAENTAICFHRHEHMIRNLTDCICRIYCRQCFLNINHSLCHQQIYSRFFQYLYLLFVHLKGILISILSLCCNKLPGCSNISCHKGSFSCHISE